MGLALGLIVVVLNGACKGPSDPSDIRDLPGPDVIDLLIIGPEAVLTTRSGITYRATAFRGDGSEEPARPVWASSNPAVATIDGSGVLTTFFPQGSTTITATQQGISATRTVQVVNNYLGSWTGTYWIRVCNQSGVFATARWCQGLGGVGVVLPATLTVEQTGGNRRQARGLMALGPLLLDLQGSITPDGRLILHGSSNVTASGVTFTITIPGWDTVLDAPSVMSGRWVQDLVATSAAGKVHIENEIVAMNRTVEGLRGDTEPSD